MASKDSVSGLWEPIVLLVLTGLADRKEDNIISRKEMQGALPDIVKLLKTAHLEIGKTPENTLDRVIQDLGKKDFLKMRFLEGGPRGSYKVDVVKAKKELEKVLPNATE